ncbi:MAG: crotonyl-CoA carboxylase/reductase, partial [Polyangiaceae bacterium]
CWRANDLVLRGTIKPCMTAVYSYAEIPRAHDDMMHNRHMGKLSCLVSAPRKGQKSRSEAV